jgi:hypothetical protein
MSNAEEDFDESAWRSELESHREEKDRIFSLADQSPIPEEDRDGFDGLEYFEPDPSYRVTATVTTHDEPETVELTVVNGDREEYHRVASFAFELHGESVSLSAYRLADGEETDEDGQYRYFAPFQDATTGENTYEGGRYLEIYTEEPLEDDQEIVLDFNVVYVPFCAFNDAFACPLAPAENWLEIPIEAGETGQYTASE